MPYIDRHIYLPILHKTSQLSIVLHSYCAWVPGTTEITESKLIKTSVRCAIKDWMFISGLLCHCDVRQWRLEGRNGRTQDDISRQTVPYPDSCTKEAVLKCIDGAGWNLEFMTMSSGAASVWNEVRWSRYWDQSMYNLIHHNGSGMGLAFLHRIPAKVQWTHKLLAVSGWPLNLLSRSL